MRQLLMLAGVSAALIVGCSGGTESSTTAEASPKTAGAGPDTVVGFDKVQAILIRDCAGCHGGPAPKAGVSFASYADTMKGGSQGPIVKPGDVAGSLLANVLTGANGAKKMPPKKPSIPDADIKTIESWIQAGAKQS